MKALRISVFMLLALGCLMAANRASAQSIYYGGEIITYDDGTFTIHAWTAVDQDLFFQSYFPVVSLMVTTPNGGSYTDSDIDVWSNGGEADAFVDIDPASDGYGNYEIDSSHDIDIENFDLFGNLYDPLGVSLIDSFTGQSDSGFLNSTQAGGGPVTPTDTNAHVADYTVKFFLPSVLIIQRTYDQISPLSENSQADQYYVSQGTNDLGVQASFLSNPQGCWAGMEFVGYVTPSDYTGLLYFQREVLSWAGYINDNQNGGSTIPFNDSGFDNQDNDPQYGTPPGKVYDWDAPGIYKGSGALRNVIYRYRANFREYVTLPNGIQISPNLNYYVRLSCQFDTNWHPSLITTQGISGDNQVGTGTTSLRSDLQ